MKNRKWQIPNTLVLIFGIMILITILTWLIPGGQYERAQQNGRTVLLPESYRQIAHEPQSLFDLLMAPLAGFTAAADIIAFVLIVGGAFTILQKSGAVNAFILYILQRQKRHPWLRKALIPIFVILFSFFGSLFGMSEEVIPFILIFVPMAISLGYDSMLGTAIPFVGAGVGFASAVFNPFTVQIAQGIAELPPLSGIGYRLICWVLFTLAAIVFLMLYASRLGRDVRSSPQYTADEYWRNQTPKSAEGMKSMQFRHGLILILFILLMAVLIAGVLRFQWWITEIAALFLLMGILTGLISGMRPGKMAEEFVEGAAQFMNVAFIIATARSILVLAEQGRIIDSILHYLSSLVEGSHAVFAAQMMLMVQSGINFFIPSGSGQAALVMPIMSPLSDLLGVTRQTAVLAFQFGDGLTNLIIPTSGVTMGVLAMARIPFGRWFRWIIPLMAVLFLLAFLLLIPPVLMHWN